MTVSVESQVKRILLRTAMGIQNSNTVFGDASSSPDYAKRFWQLVDDAGDETFENRVKGTTVSALDDVLFDGSAANVSEFASLYRLLNTYFSSDLGLSGNTGIQAYLTSKAFRVPYETNRLFTNVLGAGYTLGNQYVFPKGVRPDSGSSPATSGMHKLGSLDISNNSSLSPTNAAGWYAILGIGTQNTTGSCNLTCLNQAGASKTITGVTFDCEENHQTIVGELTVSDVTGKTLTVSAAPSTIFTVGEYAMLMYDDTPGTENVESSIREIVKVASRTDNGASSTIVVTDNIASGFTGGTIVPLFTGLVSSASGSGTGEVDLYAMPDFKIAL